MSNMPTRESEEKFFKEQEAQLIKKQREKLSQEEKEKLKKIHFGHCPKCGCHMVNITRFDVELDICPECNGIWFDCGEFEQVLKLEIEDSKNLFKKIKNLF